MGRTSQTDPKQPFRLLAWTSLLDEDLPGGRWSDLMIGPKFPVSWLPITLPRAPWPLLPLRTHSSHSYDRRYRRRSRPDLSSASRRRELPRDGCANSRETEDSPATGDRLLAKYGGGVVCPWPGKSLPEEKLARQPGLVLRHVGITQCLKRRDAA